MTENQIFINLIHQTIFHIEEDTVIVDRIRHSKAIANNFLTKKRKAHVALSKVVYVVRVVV